MSMSLKAKHLLLCVLLAEKEAVMPIQPQDRILEIFFFKARASSFKYELTLLSLFTT